MSDAAIKSNAWFKVAFSYIGAIPFSVVVFLPIILGGIVKDLGFSSQMAGYIVAADMAGFALASLIAYLWMPSFNWRIASVIATLFYILSNILSMYLDSSSALLAVRLLAGFSAGTVSACVVSTIAKTDNPSKLFGFWLIAQFVYGIVGFKYLPLLSLQACFLTFAVLSLTSLAFIKTIYSGGEEQVVSVTTATPTKWSLTALFYVLGVFIFYIGLNAVWAYFERVGDYHQLSADAMGSGFSIANVVSVVGAFIVLLIDTKKYQTSILYTLIVAIIFSVAMLLDNVTYIIFTVSASLFLFAWCVLVPIILAAIAAVDHSGRYMIMGNAALSWGLACGPALGAYIQISEGYNQVLWLGIISFVITLLLFMTAPLFIEKVPLQSSSCDKLG